MKKILDTALFVLAAVALLAACTGGPAAPAPAEIRYGETQCANCGMIINEPKFASSLAYEESAGRYKSLAFDDIGDMLAHMQKHPEIMPVGYWVHDYGTEEWIDATTAYYVESDQIRSPMGHGLAALADQGAAEKLAAEVGGQVFDWDKIRIEFALAGHHH